MVQKESVLQVADNSGAKRLKIIHICGSTRKRFAYLGDLVKCSVKAVISNTKGSVKKGEVVDVLIVRTRKEHRRADGSYIRFSENAGVILKNKQMVGTRIFGPIAREIRATGQTKILSLAPEVL